MAAVVETIEEKKHEKETIEKDVAEGMDVDKQDEEVEEKDGKKVEDGGVGKEEEAKSDDAITPKTPGSRPTRERKTVERYFGSVVARGSATKPLSIEKGQGTQLKDIPNVAYKLSKRKPDDSLQMLHSILFGKKTKAHNLKKNIGLFSGYVWVENEEKQRAKIKERLDKCVKEKLLFFCDILNIPVSRSAAKKDELSVKLLEFLESPHSTTDSLLVEKEQKSKKRKSRGKTSKKTGSLDQAAGKSAKKGAKRKRSPKIEEDESDDEPSSGRDESGDDSDDEEANEVGSDHEESGSEKEEDEEQEEEEPKKKKSNGNVSSKKDSGNKATEKAKAVKKDNPAKSPKSSTKSTTKVSSSTASKRDASDADSLVTPKKQKVEKKSQKEENDLVKENASNKKKSSNSTAKVSEKEGKEKSGKKAKAEPSNEEIHAAVVNILKEVDFNSATLSDIIRNLGSHFGVDLMHRKAEVKAIITDVINNMSDEEEGDDAEAENDEEKNEGDDAEAENDEEKNEGDDAEAENDDEKNERDGPDAANDEEKNEGNDSDA